MRCRIPAVALCVALAASPVAALAQFPGAGAPPAVTVAVVAPKPITPSQEFVGRIQSPGRVAIVARVTGFLEKQDFTEGAEVKQGQLLYEMEQPPFQADLQAKEAALAQAEAQLENARLSYQRAVSLLRTPAGQQSTVDADKATLLSDQAQVKSAQAQLAQSAINLGYTQIRAPISGRIGRSAVTPGNVVSPSSGTLVTIVSQDPMYVVFPVATRAALDLLHGVADPATAFKLRLRLSDGQYYPQTGRLDFVDNSVSQNTDTLILRGELPNPLVDKQATASAMLVRGLVDGEFVTVVVEGAKPTELAAIPRVAVMTDQQGDFVYAVDAQNKVEQVRVKLGQVSGTYVAVLSGLKDGQKVIVDGLQKVRPGQVVAPAVGT